MNSTQVIVNDFPSGRRMMIYLDPDEFRRVTTEWEDTDRILVDAQTIPFFAGRTRWCDLDPAHFRLMIASNLVKLAEMPDDQKTDDNLAVSGLHFLLAALITCIQKRAECQVELLRVNRIGEGDVTFDFSACLLTVGDLPRKKVADKTGSLRVIVDNT